MKRQRDLSPRLEVAQLAGVPRSVIERARYRLAQLEGDSKVPSTDTNRAALHTHLPATPPQQNDLFAAVTHPAVDALIQLDVDNLTPRQALDALYALKAQL